MALVPAAGDRGDPTGHLRRGVKGLLYLLLIGIAVLLGALILSALRMRRSPRFVRRIEKDHETVSGSGAGFAQELGKRIVKAKLRTQAKVLA